MNQKQKKEKAALRQRIADIMNGAAGMVVDGDEHCLIGTYEISRAMPVLIKAFNLDNRPVGEKKDFLYGWENLDEYRSVDSITDFYFEHGIRA